MSMLVWKTETVCGPINTFTNHIIAPIPVGQLPQVLVCVSNAVTSGAGTEPETTRAATEFAYFELVSPTAASSATQYERFR